MHCQKYWRDLKSLDSCSLGHACINTPAQLAEDGLSEDGDSGSDSDTSALEDCEVRDREKTASGVPKVSSMPLC